jgi:hypothetical protein
MDIMTLLGHTTLQMTSRYTHAMPQKHASRLILLTISLCPFVREARQDRAKSQQGGWELIKRVNVSL